MGRAYPLTEAENIIVGAMASSGQIDRLFNEYKDKIYRLAMSMVHNPKDAEDITQNTFIKIIRNLKYFRQKSSISTWIYRIAYNESLMFLRKKYRQFRINNRISSEFRHLPRGIFVNQSKLPDKELLDKELKGRFENAIKQLPIKYRMPLLLHYMQDLPLTQSAQILGIKVNSLKSRLHRSLLMLGSAISEYLKDKKEHPALPAAASCPSWMKFIYAFANGGLKQKTRQSFQKHIADCKNCRFFLDSYTQAILATKSLECRDIPAQLQAKIETFAATYKKEPFL